MGSAVTFDPHHLDVLGRLKTTQHQAVFDADFEYGTQPGRWESLTVGGATISHQPSLGGVRMRLGLAAGDIAIRQSRPYHRYQPGKDQRATGAVLFGPAIPGQTQRFGFFDDSNGVFIEQNGAITNAWTSRSSAADNQWRSICWAPALGLFVAVADSGTGNRVMTSPDCVTWTIRTSAADNAWQSVAWAPSLGLLVAVASTGIGNRVMTSPDGITWTIRTSAADNAWQSVTWAPRLDLFVAVADSGIGNRVMTSPDGITWTIRTSAADNAWQSVTWAPGLDLLVAVASTGSGNRVMTSTNGTIWTIRTSAADNAWESVTWAPGLDLLVAVASTGSGNRVMTSTNGTIWTIRTSAADNAWMSVCWAQALGLFVAVANTGTGNRVMTSADGVNWQARLSAADNSWNSVCWSEDIGRLAAVSITGTGNRAMSSPNAIGTNPFGMAVVIRSDINGNVVDTRIPLTSWSCDASRLAGINWNNLLMYFVEYAWYGGGGVRFGVTIDNLDLILHEHNVSSLPANTVPWCRTGNLPVRYEMRNTTAVGSTQDMVHWGVSVITEGGQDDQRGFTYGYGMAAQSPRRTIPANSVRYPLMSFRNRIMGVIEYTQSSSAITAGTTTSLTATGTPWTANQWAGRFVAYVNGGVTYTARVVSNTTSALTIADIITGGAMAAAPVAGQNYTIGLINRGQILPRGLLLNASALCQIEVIQSTTLNPIVLTGGSFVALSSLGSPNSFAERDVSATAMSGGEVVNRFTAPAGGSGLLPLDLANQFALYNNIRGNVPDILTIAVTTPAATASDVGVDVVAQEAMN